MVNFEQIFQELERFNFRIQLSQSGAVTDEFDYACGDRSHRVGNWAPMQQMR